VVYHNVLHMLFVDKRTYKGEKMKKKQRETEYRKIQSELKMTAGQPDGWTKIDKRIKALAKKSILSANDIKSMKQWIESEKEQRKEMLKIELEQINDFFKQYKETPKILRQIGLYKKGLNQGSPMYDTLLDAQKIELEECFIKLEYGFKPKNVTFAWMEDERWQKLMVNITERKKEALKKQIEDIEKSLAEVEEEIEKEKGVKDKRVAQIKEELKELGEKFPKDELQYIG